MTNGEGINPKAIGVLWGLLGLTVGFVPSYFLAHTGLEVLRTDIANMKAQIAASSDDRWRGADAKASHQLIDERDRGMQEAIKQNAAHIKELELLMRDHVTERGVHN